MPKDEAAVGSAVQLAAAQRKLREGRDGSIADHARGKIEPSGESRLPREGHDPFADERLRSIASGSITRYSFEAVAALHKSHTVSSMCFASLRAQYDARLKSSTSKGFAP